MKTKAIYVIQSYSSTVPARIIRGISRYKYSHVMIAIDNNFEKLYSFGRRKVNNPFNCGFIIESINGEFFKKYNGTECKVYQINISERKYEKLKKILDEFEKNPHKYNYDTFGLFLKIFHIYIKRKNHYVCSQFVADVMDKSTIHKFSKPVRCVVPKDFDDISNNVIFKGKISDYKVLV